MDKIGEYLQEKLSGDNLYERNLLCRGFDIGNALAMADTLRFIEENTKMTFEEFKLELINTVNITELASEMHELLKEQS